MSGSTYQAVSYLIGTLIDLYVAAILLRLLLQIVRADFYNPLCQFLVTVTNPVVVPFRRFIPSIGPIDTASVVVMILLQTIGVYLIITLGDIDMSPVQVVVYSCIKILMMTLLTYTVVIIVSVILSWLGPRAQHPIVPLIHQLTEPVLRPFRRIIPAIGGIDLSPLFALITIRFLMLLLGW
ncbi:MAG TPA: YggT family protein [Xanthomonadales bacterium]|nr:YggT family protein [Xanthomonadales bacterium]